MELDEEKCTLTVVGDVDPVLIVNALRKSKKCAVIESVGPDKEPEKAPEKAKPECKPCGTCRQVAFGDIVWYDAQPIGCTIL
ncbi:hypothetical protein ACMD2_26564 [Ananas comosus]|uniref:HMA domain-containing protein n=1 Tax=Ananas comosus TaxID=4615 RepID=A0A199V389_ANACO|nr:hypothetical protein ACMD2_26564 [Ananas comosus]